MYTIAKKLHNSVNFSESSRWILNIAIVVMGSLLIALGAKMAIPMVPVPITLQTFAILFLAMLFGAQFALAAVALYLIEAVIGLPVLASPVANIADFFGPSGGYLAGFLVAAGFAGYMSERGYCQSRTMAFLTAFFSGLIVLVAGTIYLSFLVGPKVGISTGLLPFLPGNVVKAIILALVVPTILAHDAKR